MFDGFKEQKYNKIMIKCLNSLIWTWYLDKREMGNGTDLYDGVQLKNMAIQTETMRDAMKRQTERKDPDRNIK